MIRINLKLVINTGFRLYYFFFGKGCDFNVIE